MSKTETPVWQLHSHVSELDHLSPKIEQACSGYLSFIHKCFEAPGHYRFTLRSDITPFALCFAVFGLKLLRYEDLQMHADEISQYLRKNLVCYRTDRASQANLQFDKPYLQLLTFTLSCFSALGRIATDPLAEFVQPLLVRNVRDDLDAVGALSGRPQSGNLAMFMAILLVHARDHLGLNTQPQIDEWIDAHLHAMNAQGFWGDANGMTHLQFQNGYHQYEIFEFLRIKNPKAEVAAQHVEVLADKDGHFAPYPGGGGCYDYDAVALLTADGLGISEERQCLLLRLISSILASQNANGGFGESPYVRPRSIPHLWRFIFHVLTARGATQGERLRTVLNLLRPKHNRIHTHWSTYSREWHESNLWDSWFRMLAVARVQCAIDPTARASWGFIEFPGIGYVSPRNM